MTDDEMDWSLLDRYLSGRCSAAEIAAVQQWAARDPSNARTLASVQRIWDESGIIAERFDAETAIRTLRSTRVDALQDVTDEMPVIGDALSVAEDARHSARQRRPFFAATPRAPALSSQVWLMLAAAGILIAAAGVSQLRLVSREPNVAQSLAAVPREFTTQRAQLAQVRLSDGSTIDLAPESRLTVPADYGSTRREVTLDGEGFFTVVHDQRLPFTVKSGSAVVHDIGTKFVVRHYTGDSVVRVVVSEGSVRLTAQGAEESTAPVLTRGDLARVRDGGDVAVSHGVDMDQYMGWTSGRLTFVDVPLDEVLAQVGRWYDVRVVLGDSALKKQRMTMSVPTTSISALVEGIGLALDVRAQRRGDTIVLRARPR
ncbi:MAG TPA: FecR domain-containing protein [Gemmatimonadaceae bacterium]|jgi:ferric-dicitrate binding protein FerR (iron transport regulator)|nr:FecR domain-containing protein [Gemmatimonadaceae bacterium]